MHSLSLATRGVYGGSNQSLSLATRGFIYSSSTVVYDENFIPYFIIPARFFYIRPFYSVGDGSFFRPEKNVYNVGEYLSSAPPIQDVGNMGEALSVHSVGSNILSGEEIIINVGEPTLDSDEITITDVGEDLPDTVRGKRKIFKFYL